MQDNKMNNENGSYQPVNYQMNKQMPFPQLWQKNAPAFNKNAGVIRLILLVLFIVSFFTVHFAMMLSAAISDDGAFSSVKNSWLFYLMLPIPLTSLVIGIIYKRKGFKSTKNIVVGIIFTILLLIYGSFSFFFNNVSSDDYSYVTNIETEISFDLPNEGKISTMNWTSGTQTSVIADIMSDVAFTNEEEISKFNIEISESDLWVTSMKTTLTSLLPLTYSSYPTSDLYDYFMIYNIDLKIYNVLPKHSGTYRYVFIAYNSSKGTMKIGEYSLDFHA